MCHKPCGQTAEETEESAEPDERQEEEELKVTAEA